MYLMKLPEDGPRCGPKHVATIKQNQREYFDWFAFIVVLTAKYHKSCYTTGVLVTGPVETHVFIFVSKTFACFEMGPPLPREKRSNYYRSPPSAGGDKSGHSVNYLTLSTTHTSLPKCHSVCLVNCCWLSPAQL
jgi:hypothetical protein